MSERSDSGGVWGIFVLTVKMKILGELGFGKGQRGTGERLGMLAFL